MKFHFAVLLLLVFALVGNSFADGSYEIQVSTPQDQKISFQNKQWYIGSRAVDADEAVETLKSKEESASAYGTAMGFYYPGLVLAYTGGAALGVGVGQLLWGDTELGAYLSIGGVGVIGISLLLTRIANSYMHDAIDLYNKGIGIPETALKLKLVPTQQGGIAVALAF